MGTEMKTATMCSASSRWAVSWAVVGMAVLGAAAAWRAAMTWLWLDEVYTAYAMEISNFQELLRWNIVSEMNPPAFYVAEWLWTRLVGNGDFALRLLPIAFACAAYLFVAITIFRAFGFWASAIIVPLTFAAFCRPTTFCEARPTINLIFAIAAAGYVHERVASGKYNPLWLTATHGYVCLTHTLGCLYSGSIFVALALTQIARRDIQWRVLVAVAGGWTAFFAWLPALILQHQNTQPHYWIPPPDALAFVRTVAGIVNLPIVLFAFAVTMPIVEWWRCGDHERGNSGARSRETLLAIGAGLVLGTPVAAFLVSTISTSVFLDRYLLGGVVGWTIVLSAAWEGIFGSDRLSEELASVSGTANQGSVWKRRVFRVVAGMAVIGLAIPALFVTPSQRPGGWVSATVPSEIPLIFESPHLFLPALRYSPRQKMFFVLDKEAALDPRADKSAIDHFYSFVLLKRFFPDFPVLTKEELDALPEFAIVEDAHEKWADIRFANNPKYLFKPLATKPQSVVLLRRRNDGDE